MAKKVEGEPNIKQLPSGLYFAQAKIAGKNVNLPALCCLNAVKEQRDILCLKRDRLPAEALAYAETLKRARATESSSRTGERCVVPSGTLFCARVGRRGETYEGPRRKTAAEAAADRDELERSEDIEITHEQLLSRAEPLRTLPKYVYRNRHGLYFAGVNDPHKGVDVNGRCLQVAGPPVPTVEEASEHVAVFLHLRSTGFSLRDAALAFHEERAFDRGSFVEAKGGGWQPKGVVGCPFYVDIVDAVDAALRLRQMDEDARGVFLAHARECAEARAEEDKRRCLTSGPRGHLTPRAQKAPLIWMTVCAPLWPDRHSRVHTERILQGLLPYLERAFHVTLVPGRDCLCSSDDGLCRNYTGADVAEARRRFGLAVQGAQAAPICVLSGRTFAPLAREAARARVASFAYVAHPSRWFTHLHATRAAEALNGVLGEGVVTPWQLHCLARECLSENQVCRFLDKE